MDKTRYLVVGAGISGLAFADWLRSDDYIICEAESEVGGYCRTVKQDGFVWDYSGHFFHFRHPEIEQYLVARMTGQRVLKIKRDSRILYRDAFIDFPFQKNIHQLEKEEFIDCLYDLFFRHDQPSTNFHEMLYAKFGKSISEKFLVPYNEKLYATDLRRLDVDAMGRFFPHADLTQIVRNFRDPDNRSYNSTFTYPEGGAIQYVHALLHGVRQGAMCLEERVNRIDLDKKIAHTNKRTIGFEHLISSAPWNRLLSAAQVPHDKSLYTYNKVQVFNLGFDSKGLPNVHWIYVPDPKVSFYRVGFYDNIFGADRMSLYVEIGLPSDAVVTPSDVEATKERVLGDLKQCGIVTTQKLVASHHVILDPAYVHITRAATNDLREKSEWLALHGVHSIGRYGTWTYCSIEDNMVEARALADKFNALENA